MELLGQQSFSNLFQSASSAGLITSWIFVAYFLAMFATALLKSDKIKDSDSFKLSFSLFAACVLLVGISQGLIALVSVFDLEPDSGMRSFFQFMNGGLLALVPIVFSGSLYMAFHSVYISDDSGTKSRGSEDENNSN